MKIIGICMPKICKRFRLLPYWMNSVTWQPGDIKVYRWLWFNWTVQ